MAMTNPARQLGRRDPVSETGPAVTFGIAVVVTLGTLMFAPAIIPNDWVMPLVSSMFLLFAAIVAFAGWRLGHTHSHRALSYWDVAGALVLFGVFSGILVEPEQLVRLVEGAQQPADK